MYESELMDEIQIAVDLKRQGKYEESLKKYQELNVIYPDHPHVFKGWAKTLASYGFFDKALEYFQKATNMFRYKGDENNEWQCQSHVDQLIYFKNNGYDSSDMDFRIYLHGVSGGVADFPGGYFNFKVPEYKSNNEYVIFCNQTTNINENSTKKYPDLPQGISFVSIPAVTEPYVMNPNDGGTFSVTLSSYEMSAALITNAQYAQYLNDALASGYIQIKKSSTFSFTGEVRIEKSVWGTTGDWKDKEYIDLSSFSQINHNGNLFSIDVGKEYYPIYMVSWYGAKAFAKYYGIDIPTEAEWQYAASGGKNYEYGTIDGNIDKNKTNYNENVGCTTEVNRYPANPFNLFDMAGNLCEWCHDWYGEYPYGMEHNYMGISNGATRVNRGGFWGSIAIWCKVDDRNNSNPNFISSSIGFRVVRRKKNTI